MNLRIWAAPVLGLFCSLFALGVTAQNVQKADYIVAVVNSEPITNSEVESALKRLLNEIAAQRQTAPPAAELRRRVLERLINERAQLQEDAAAGRRDRRGEAFGGAAGGGWAAFGGRGRGARHRGRRRGRY